MNRTDELMQVGLKLQQSLVLTRVRVANLPDSPTKAKALRAVRVADDAFQRISSMVQSAQSMTAFLNRNFGMNLTDLFSVAAPAHAGVARAAESVGVELVINKTRSLISELHRINLDLDNEEKDHG